MKGSRAPVVVTRGFYSVLNVLNTRGRNTGRVCRISLHRLSPPSFRILIRKFLLVGNACRPSSIFDPLSLWYVSVSMILWALLRLTGFPCRGSGNVVSMGCQTGSFRTQRQKFWRSRKSNRGRRVPCCPTLPPPRVSMTCIQASRLALIIRSSNCPLSWERFLFHS